MTHYLAYWKTFHEEVITENVYLIDPFQWFSDKEWFHKKVNPGDIIWVVGRARLTAPDDWRLLEKLVVTQRSIRVKTASGRRKYKKYKVPCDSVSSFRYNPASHTNIESLLKKLEFKSGKQITRDGSLIGMCIQQTRELTMHDINRLNVFSRNLPILKAGDKFLPF